MTKEFHICEKEKIVCNSESTRNGFRHIAEYYIEGELVGKSKVCYQNRTWESFEFQTVISCLIDELNLDRELITSITSGKAKSELDSNLKTVGTIASLGNLFCEDIKDKNAWKLRMIKAGVGSGLQLPSNWEELTEEEKELRLDKIIEFQKGGIND